MYQCQEPGCTTTCVRKRDLKRHYGKVHNNREMDERSNGTPEGGSDEDEQGESSNAVVARGRGPPVFCKICQEPLGCVETFQRHCDSAKHLNNAITYGKALEENKPHVLGVKPLSLDDARQAAYNKALQQETSRQAQAQARVAARLDRQKKHDEFKALCKLIEDGEKKASSARHMLNIVEQRALDANNAVEYADIRLANMQKALVNEMTGVEKATAAMAACETNLQQAIQQDEAAANLHKEENDKANERRKELQQILDNAKEAHKLAQAEYNKANGSYTPIYNNRGALVNRLEAAQSDCKKANDLYTKKIVEKEAADRRYTVTQSELVLAREKYTSSIADAEQAAFRADIHVTKTAKQLQSRQQTADATQQAVVQAQAALDEFDKHHDVQQLQNTRTQRQGELAICHQKVTHAQQQLESAPVMVWCHTSQTQSAQIKLYCAKCDLAKCETKVNEIQQQIANDPVQRERDLYHQQSQQQLKMQSEEALQLAQTNLEMAHAEMVSKVGMPYQEAVSYFEILEEEQERALPARKTKREKIEEEEDRIARKIARKEAEQTK